MHKAPARGRGLTERSALSEMVPPGLQEGVAVEIAGLLVGPGALHPRLLRGEDLGEERLLRALGEHLIPGLELVLKEPGACLDDTDAALSDLVEVLGVARLRLPKLIARRR